MAEFNFVLERAMQTVLGGERSTYQGWANYLTCPLQITITLIKELNYKLQLLKFFDNNYKLQLQIGSI